MMPPVMERLLPLIGFGAFLLLGVGFRVWLQRHRYGSSGVQLFTDRRPGQLVRDAGLVCAALLLLAQAVVIAMDPARVERVFRCPPVLAAAVLGLGLVVMVAAQLQLGASWRIGIEPGARTGLVTRGLYRWSRNPIFVGLFLVLAGTTLAAPTWLSLIVFVGTSLGVRLQVAAEEAHLRSTYGHAFAEYAARVGRFLPGLGKSSPPDTSEVQPRSGGGSGESSGGGGTSSSRIST